MEEIDHPFCPRRMMRQPRQPARSCIGRAFASHQLLQCDCPEANPTVAEKPPPLEVTGMLESQFGSEVHFYQALLLILA